MGFLTMDRHNKYVYLGFVFVFIEILVIIRNLVFNLYYDFFWACDIFPILLAVLFFLKKDQAIKGIVSFGFIVQNVYVASALLAWVSGVHYFFMDRYINSFYFLVAIIIHIIPINLALLATYKVKTEKVSLAYSIFFAVFLFFFTLIFTPLNLNINFVKSINIFAISGINVTFVWIPLVFILIIVPGYLIQKFLHSKFYGKSPQW
jgi:hypothetical protein